jgi:soluble lytic murein transglycosylase-like protein
MSQQAGHLVGDSGNRYAAEIEAAARAYPNVPESWIWAVIGAESSFRDIYRTWEPKVKEFAYGPMQVLASTGAGLGYSEEQLQTAAGSIAAGTALLSQLIGRIGMDFKRVYSAYNSGSPDKWTEGGQVAANVARAADWLSDFVRFVEDTGTEVGAAVGGPGWLLGGLVLLGLWYLSTQHGTRHAAA